jgi:hypothetical protein
MICPFATLSGPPLWSVSCDECGEALVQRRIKHEGRSEVFGTRSQACLGAEKLGWTVFEEREAMCPPCSRHNAR